MTGQSNMIPKPWLDKHNNPKPIYIKKKVQYLELSKLNFYLDVVTKVKCWSEAFIPGCATCSMGFCCLKDM